MLRCSCLEQVIRDQPMQGPTRVNIEVDVATELQHPNIILTLAYFEQQVPVRTQNVSPQASTSLPSGVCDAAHARGGCAECAATTPEGSGSSQGHYGARWWFCASPVQESASGLHCKLELPTGGAACSDLVRRGIIAMKVSGVYSSAHCQCIANTAKPHIHNSSHTLDCNINKVKIVTFWEIL